MGDRLGILGAVNLLYILLSFHFYCRQGGSFIIFFQPRTGDGREGKTGREGQGQASCLQGREGRNAVRPGHSVFHGILTLNADTKTKRPAAGRAFP